MAASWTEEEIEDQIENKHGCEFENEKKHESENENENENKPNKKTKIRKRVLIGYLGPPGTYSHQAALQSYKDYNIENHHKIKENKNIDNDDVIIELVSYSTISSCFYAASRSLVDFSIIPIENSTNGPVQLSFYELRDIALISKLPKSFKYFEKVYEENTILKYASRFTKLQIIEEEYVSVMHSVIGNIDRSQLSSVKKVYSHPQVWGQCDLWIKKNLPLNIERVDMKSTTDAAYHVSLQNKASNTDSESNTDTKKDQFEVAISSEIAAQIYNVPIIEKRINNKSDNCTRFVKVKRIETPGCIDKLYDIKDINPIFSYKTMLRINEENNNLNTILQIFLQYYCQICYINSCPDPQISWKYIYLIEVTGHCTISSNLLKVFKKLEELEIKFSILGSYRNLKPLAVK